MKSKVILGILLITMGLGLFIFYDQYMRPEREARELLVEGKMVVEREDEKARRDRSNTKRI